MSQESLTDTDAARGEATREADAAPSGTENEKGIRMDIQGIRALAIVLVVFAHAGVPGLAGGFIGIDVFFVVSGFLITGLLVREVKTKGRISLKDFYARRARRLLPLASIVLVFTALGSLLLYDLSDQITVGKQIVGAALYFVNWLFAFQEVDYFTGGAGFVSPVLHFWSLSVEEQFYLTWPLLMLVATGVALRSGRRIEKTLLLVLVPLALASLGYSVLVTQTDPELAYFSSLTRIWELAFGAILAIVLPRSLDLSGWLSNTLVAGGLVAIVGCALLVDDGSPFPGWQALIPVFGTIAILVGGTARRRTRASSVLCARPAQYLGDLSYAWYLWHWPILTFALVLWPGMGLVPTVAIGLASLLPSAITHSLIENPVRRSRVLRRLPRRALAVGAFASVIAASSGLALASRSTPVKVVPADQVAGAKVIPRPGKVPFQKEVFRIAPNPLKGVEDRGELFYDGCMAWAEEVTLSDCTYGNPESDEKVLVFGDSRAMSYFPAVEKIAERRDWRLTGLTRGNCLIADVVYEPYCDTWRENMMDRIEAERPGLIILGTATKSLYSVKVGGRTLSRTASQPYLIEGMARTIRRLKAETGARIVVMRDQVFAPFKPPNCVATWPRQLAKCAFRPKDRSARAFELQAARRTGAVTIDPLPMFCSKRLCPSVIGNVLVYQDVYHLSATYAATLDAWLERRLPPLATGTGTG